MAHFLQFETAVSSKAIVGGATPGHVVLDSIRRHTEQAAPSMVSASAPASMVHDKKTTDCCMRIILKEQLYCSVSRKQSAQ